MNQVLSSSAIRIFGFFLSLLVVFPHCAIAGWFGPDNYEECMLDKMKGQDRSMRGIANNACLSMFPRPMQITVFAGFGDDKEIKLLLDGSNIRIIRNNSPYQITAVTLLLSKKNCADTRKYNILSRYDNDFSPIEFKVKGSIGAPDSPFKPSDYNCTELYHVYGLPK